MRQTKTCAPQPVARLIPRELGELDLDAMSPFARAGNSFEQSDLICAGLEEMSRHLRRLDDDFRAGQFDRIEMRARALVVLADQLGLCRVGQVAADVVYCVTRPDEIALSATLSRLMRLVSQALDHAADPLPAL
ncbi:hypothetical protein [Thalassorhabdomicrobium marinisediminis]|uniref:Uncharacterized protein n=1 Tax=Thalassorhabdomicrobium marinisediminis TaxID=2170577 RepID=A0A2T7FVV0_9RHOB|nr:hypothetical protein [Thalassorhabdomicrobium marinisediminis]PVA06282.1 hypothetical protein DC363_10255 [Thalassorhabdomicrobium marinisediminis]